jgi:uncharacterized OB-fold protein
VTDTDLLPCGPGPDGVDEPFWSGLATGVVRLPRCTRCGTWRAPGQVLCRACRSFATAWEQVQPTGHVFTWARTHRAFMSELDAEVPYTTVLVELDECRVRLLGLLRGATDVAIGDRVVGQAEQPPGSPWHVLRWRTSS